MTIHMICELSPHSGSESSALLAQHLKFRTIHIQQCTAAIGANDMSGQDHTSIQHEVRALLLVLKMNFLIHK